MRKRVLSIWLALCMLLTLLPISAMAVEADTSIGASGEIIAFTPLDETKLSFPTGTAIEDLELPESLTATVKTTVPDNSGTTAKPMRDSGNPDEGSVSGSLAVAPSGSAIEAETNESQEQEEEETTAPEWEEKITDIPVTWEAEPEYDGNENGVYIFTPVIAGYTVRAALPEITVTVGEMPLAAARAAGTTDPQANWGVAGDGGTAPSDWVNSGTLADAVNYARYLSSGTAYIQLLENVTTTTRLSFYENKSTILDLNGKAIDRDLDSSTNNGNVITVMLDGNLTLKDSSAEGQGKIAGGHNQGNGGGVVINGGSFTMQGGNITGNKSSNNTGASGGGGVYIQSGSFTMTGGSINNNEAINCGGGVFMSGGSFTMQGGNITGNKSSSNSGATGGGGVYVNNGSFTMTDGSINNNEAINNGGGVYGVNGSFTMLSGTITANKSANSGVCISSGFTFTVGGTAVINHNTVYNVRPRSSGITIAVSSDTPLTEGASIGVTAYASPLIDSPVNVTGPNTSDYSGYFFSDNSSYIIQNGAGNVVQLAVFVDPDIAIVAAARNTLADGSVDVAFGADQTAKTAAVQAYVNGLLTGTGVSAIVTYNGGTGKYDVALSKGSVNDSKSLSMTVNIAPDPDIAIVAAARNTLADGSVNVAFGASQGDKTAAVQDYVNNRLAGAGVSATVTYNGSTGKYDVTLSKGNVNESKSLSMTVIIAPDPDIAIVAAAKSALVDGSVNVAFGADQTAKTAAVQDYVDNRLTGTGVSAIVTYNGGTGKYDVALSKGSVHESKSLSMTVIIAPDPDIAIVAGAKSAAQNTRYADMTQTEAADEDAIKTALKNTAETAVGSDVTVTINTVSYTPPIAGTSANPSGTDGSYTFTVTVSKGTPSETTEEKTIAITATAYTGGTGSNDNDDSGSGGGSSTSSLSTKPTEPVTGSTENKATVDNKGNVSVSLTDKNITDAIADAKAEAAKKGVNAGDITAVIHVTTGGKDADTVTLNLPKTTQEQVIANKIASVQLVIDRPGLTIGIDLAAVMEINRQAKADVQLSATRMDNAKLSGEAKAAIGSRPAYDLKALYGSGKSVTDFGKGSVSVEIPYTLQKGEIAGSVYAVYVDTKGKVTYLTNSSYDAKRGTVVFSTSHFSTYGVAYKASFQFTDINGHWAKDDILFVASRGLMTGTSATTFSPNGSMTREMFVTALGRLENADISAYKQSNFIDVKADAYYMGYIEWGVKNNILVGIGGGKFDPDGFVTREQMAVMMDRYATAIGFKLPEVHTQNVFADNAKIGAWAAPSVKRIQMAGIIQGKSKNYYDPQGTATRAEVSAVLRRFVELAIFSDTAQDWTMNDSGKWMYYENSKPVTGKKEIDGSTYTFDQYGVTADVPKNLRYTTYTVQKGDSFWLIAHKLGCTMNQLERLNNKNRFSLICPGDVLRVPEK